MKKCNHKCTQCVQEEINKLQREIDELKKQLPPEQIILPSSPIPYIPTYPSLPYPTTPFPLGPYIGDPPMIYCATNKHFL